MGIPDVGMLSHRSIRLFDWDDRPGGSSPPRLRNEAAERGGSCQRCRDMDAVRLDRSDHFWSPDLHVGPRDVPLQQILPVQNNSPHIGHHFQLHHPSQSAIRRPASGDRQARGGYLSPALGLGRGRRVVYCVCVKGTDMTIYHDIQSIGFLTDIRESALVYPVIMTTHLACIAVFGGLILITDLRMLGVALK